jgi:hypothetical protein
MKPRNDQIPFLTRALSTSQARELRQWLVTEGITYKAAVQRLKERFGVHTSTAQLGRFYQRHCCPRPSVSSWCGHPIALDLRISRRGDAWQFRILQRAPGIRAYVEGKKLKATLTRQVKS